MKLKKQGINGWVALSSDVLSLAFMRQQKKPVQYMLLINSDYNDLYVRSEVYLCTVILQSSLIGTFLSQVSFG